MKLRLCCLTLVLAACWLVPAAIAQSPYDSEETYVGQDGSGKYVGFIIRHRRGNPTSEVEGRWREYFFIGRYFPSRRGFRARFSTTGVRIDGSVSARGVFRLKVEGDASKGGVAFCRSTSSVASSPPRAAQDAPNAIVGEWYRKSDGGKVVFSKTGRSSFVGHISNLGTGARYHFTVGEEVFRLKYIGPGRYSGTVKWRWTDGRQEWRSTVQVVSGKTMHGTGEWVHLW